MERHGTPDIDELWALVRRQQELIEQLQAQIGQMAAERTEPIERTEAPAVAGPTRSSSRRLSRRGLFRAAAMGAAATAGAAVMGHLGAEPASATSFPDGVE